MKKQHPLTTTTRPSASTERPGIAGLGWLPLLCLMLPATARAQFNYETNSGEITITRYTGPGGAVAIPDSINGLAVTSIGDFAFEGSSAATVVLPQKCHQDRDWRLQLLYRS